MNKDTDQLQTDSKTTPYESSTITMRDPETETAVSTGSISSSSINQNRILIAL